MRVDAMDDNFAEDTLMDCAVDDQDYVNLPELSNAGKSAATIRGAVEKLLTLLESNDEEDELLSCSEDEGVEADLSESEECFEDTSNLKVLYQLALLLTEELKCPRLSSWQCADNVDSMEVVQRSTSQCDEAAKCLGNKSSLNRLSPEVEMKDDACMWSTGWDACASEAVRYLIEVEGLPAFHPTVSAMKSYLQTQRDQLSGKT